MRIQIDLPGSGLVLEACLDLPAVSGPFPGVCYVTPIPFTAAI